MPSPPPRNQTPPIAFKKHAEVDVKLPWPCPASLDSSIQPQIPRPGLYLNAIRPNFLPHRLLLPPVFNIRDNFIHDNFLKIFQKPRFEERAPKIVFNKVINSSFNCRLLKHAFSHPKT